jgi:hypothetical protein
LTDGTIIVVVVFPFPKGGCTRDRDFGEGDAEEVEVTEMVCRVKENECRQLAFCFADVGLGGVEVEDWGECSGPGVEIVGYCCEL